ncbi:MAG TPA: HhH-GPD-type base excision DNA repair protein [Cryptosporangiaceae bacterium]|nr:HhH-GPD-type base excision DNA repair protein [Cryptosporangiaceae bacterium]
MVALQLSQDPDADALLSVDPLALLVGMLLDQQTPMERAFAAPYRLAERLGVERLDAAVLAEADPEAFAAMFARPPALHRFPGSMAGRVQALAAHLGDHWRGDPTVLWSTAESGAELLGRLRDLPGFGEQKARIFLALLGKQLGIRPPGWREAAGPYGEPGVTRSIADVTGPESLREVREHKRAMKAAAKAGG